MYSVSVTCSDHKNCSMRVRLGPPDSDCFYAEKMNKSREQINECQQNANYAEFEFADDAIDMDKKGNLNQTKNRQTASCNKEQNPYITVNGKEELPCVHEIKYYMKENNTNGVKEIFECHSNKAINKNKPVINKNFNGNFNKINMRNVYSYCTLPKNKKKINYAKYNPIRHINPPKRITPDGTHIYYWCDIPKKDICGK